MAENQKPSAPTRAFLEMMAQNVMEWVPQYQFAPSTQRNSSSPYVPSVSCDIGELDFDAYVSSLHGQRPSYHFSVAVPLAINYLALALTATEEFMPEVPLNPLLTVREDPENNQLYNFTDWRYLLDSEGEIRPLRRTDDNCRYPIGDTLWALAVQLIALHEEGHYVNGHLDPSLGFCERGIYSEKRKFSSAITSDELLTYRALELDADHYAASHMLLPLLSGRETEYLSNVICELGRNPFGYTRFLGCASAMLGMIIWQAEGGTMGPPSERRMHPTPFCRIVHFAYLTSFYFSYFCKSEDQAQTWNETLNRDVTEIINLFGLETFVNFTPDADTPWRNEWQETKRRLNQIKPGMSEAAARARKTIGIPSDLKLPGDLPFPTK